MSDPVTVTGLDECIAAFKGFEADLRKQANGELRAAAKQAAEGVPGMLGGSGAPQEAAILAASGPKADRYVVVAVPNRKPKLSGLKRTPAAQAKRLGFAIEGGSDAPQFHGPAAGAMVERHRPQIVAHVVPRYERAIAALMTKWSLR